MPNEPTSPAAAPELPPNSLTPEQSGKIAAVLFDPTVERIRILLQTLVQSTAAGDYAIWASLVALDRVIAELDWASVSSSHAQRFAHLAELVFQRCALRLAAYRAAIMTWQEGTPFPQLTPWGNEDTLYVLSVVEETDRLATEQKGPTS
jgi:hypothetical protein